MEKLDELIDLLIATRLDDIVVSKHYISSYEMARIKGNPHHPSKYFIAPENNMIEAEEHKPYYIINLNYRTQVNHQQNNDVYENSIIIYEDYVTLRYISSTDSLEETYNYSILNKYNKILNNAMEERKNKKVDEFFSKTYTNLKLDRHFKIKGIL
jgi:hypothetical protein